MPFCYGLSIKYFSVKLLYDGITEEQTIFAHNIQTGVALMFQNFLLIEAAMNIILYKKLYLSYKNVCRRCSKWVFPQNSRSL